MSKQLIINGIIIPEGAHLQVNINSYRLPTRTTIDIPAFVYNAKKKGPVVLFIAGMHGDEINGIEIVRRLIREKHLLNLETGAVIAVPVMNIISFLNNSRDLPDGKDLNRCFPGNKSGSYGSRIANDLMTEILPLIDVGVDFHTGGAQICNSPQVRCVFDDPQSLALAKEFGAEFIINSPYRDKSFRKEAARKGKSILVYEAGESMRFNKIAVEEGLRGCLQLLENLKMMKPGISQKVPTILRKSSWIRARASGMFWSYKKLGSKVVSGEEIGIISDPYGESETALITPESGYIIGVNNKPVVNAGDAIFHIGME